jgi:hypothetical protein
MCQWGTLGKNAIQLGSKEGKGTKKSHTGLDVNKTLKYDFLKQESRPNMTSNFTTMGLIS